jgi:hypothetical protein
VKAGRPPKAAPFHLARRGGWWGRLRVRGPILLGAQQVAAGEWPVSPMAVHASGCVGHRSACCCSDDRSASWILRAGRAGPWFAARPMNGHWTRLEPPPSPWPAGVPPPSTDPPWQKCTAACRHRMFVLRYVLHPIVLATEDRQLGRALAGSRARCPLVLLVLCAVAGGRYRVVPWASRGPMSLTAMLYASRTTCEPLPACSQ